MTGSRGSSPVLPSDHLYTIPEGRYHVGRKQAEHYCRSITVLDAATITFTTQPKLNHAAHKTLPDRWSAHAAILTMGAKNGLDRNAQSYSNLSRQLKMESKPCRESCRGARKGSEAKSTVSIDKWQAEEGHN